MLAPRARVGLRDRLALVAVAFVTTTTVPHVASAQTAATAQTADQARAAEHFQRAKDLYQAGSYRDAITELEAARALDPKAKELVFNLGIVHEKLGRFDDAIAWFEKYLGMDGVTAAERAKAESVIKRIEGAKREVASAQAAPSPTSEPSPAAPPPSHEPPAHGRIDALTVTAAVLTGVSLGVGAAFGIRAVALRPTGFVTGRDGTYEDLRKDTDAAHTSAIVADVAFGIGLASAITTVVLYAARTKTPSATERGATHVTVGGVDHGATLGLGGTF